MIAEPLRVATLIVNPAAGRARLLESQIPAIAARLQSAGYGMQLRYTTPEPGSAEAEAEAAEKDSALVIACGGDGTVHGIVQRLANTRTPLGVIPLGTANALARNLRLPMDPFAALGQLLTYRPRRIPLGLVDTAPMRRFFLIMAGCGPDGSLVHSLSAGEKSRFGRKAYYAHAARLFFTRSWPEFQAECVVNGIRTTTRAVAMMAARVPDLGGAFAGLTPLGSLTTGRLQVQLLRSPAAISLPAWFSLTRVGMPNPWLKTIEADEVHCTPLSETPVYAQADAEPIGALPLSLRIAPAALTLLMPR